MTPQKENPAQGAAAGLPDMSCLDGIDTQDIAPKPAPAQDKKAEIDPAIICWSLVENTGLNAGLLINQLDAALAMGRAGSAPGFLHGLRRAREVWTAISLDAKKFAELTGKPDIAPQKGEARS
jgi:hypothetical protein